MTRFICAALAAFALATTGTAFGRQSAQAGPPDGKIAVVNTDVFPEKIAELKQKFDQVDSQFRARFDRIKQMSEDMKKMEEELTSKTITADRSRQLQSQYEDLKRKGTREEADLHDEVSRALEMATEPIQEKMKKFMGAYAAQRNIVAVFNLTSAAETGLFAFWNPGTDITNDFIAEYNKANPVAAAPAPGSPTGAKAPAKP